MTTESLKAGALEPLINVPGMTKHFTSENHERKWLLVDAQGQRVGRLATTIADLLRGKHKPTFTRHDDVGDFVVVINASGLVLHGNDKARKKIYYKYTGWRGHLKRRTGEDLLAKKPEVVLRHAVYGMIPSGALCNRQMKKLKIYAGAEHPHKAQQPAVYSIAKK